MNTQEHHNLSIAYDRLTILESLHLLSIYDGYFDAATQSLILETET